MDDAAEPPRDAPAGPSEPDKGSKRPGRGREGPGASGQRVAGKSAEELQRALHEEVQRLGGDPSGWTCAPALPSALAAATWQPARRRGEPVAAPARARGRGSLRGHPSRLRPTRPEALTLRPLQLRGQAPRRRLGQRQRPLLPVARAEAVPQPPGGTPFAPGAASPLQASSQGSLALLWRARGRRRDGAGRPGRAGRGGWRGLVGRGQPESRFFWLLLISCCQLTSKPLQVLRALGLTGKPRAEAAARAAVWAAAHPPPLPLTPHLSVTALGARGPSPPPACAR